MGEAVRSSGGTVGPACLSPGERSEEVPVPVTVSATAQTRVEMFFEKPCQLPEGEVRIQTGVLSNVRSR